MRLFLTYGFISDIEKNQICQLLVIIIKIKHRPGFLPSLRKNDSDKMEFSPVWSPRFGSWGNRPDPTFQGRKLQVCRWGIYGSQEPVYNSDKPHVFSPHSALWGCHSDIMDQTSRVEWTRAEKVEQRKPGASRHPPLEAFLREDRKKRWRKGSGSKVGLYLKPSTTLWNDGGAFKGYSYSGDPLGFCQGHMVLDMHNPWNKS